VAVANLFSGDYDAATSSARSVVDDDPAFMSETSLPELVEAATRAGHRQVAATAFETLSQRALATGTPWALGLRARCQALLNENGDAEDAYLESLSQLAHSRATIELARTHLLYGQWLRRARRRRDARQELLAAQDMFAAMGADHFTELAGTELRATGARARVRSPETTLDLTPQEARVGGLSAGGASNNEIASQLFISPSTVDYHLRKVYRKLNVTSRGQLARSLGPAPGSTGPGGPGPDGH
jgi:DNA-binding CsgD family transcriptional regulator